MTLRYDYHKAAQWSPARVSEWLLDLSPAFASYAAAALRSGFDGAALLSLATPASSSADSHSSSTDGRGWDRCGVQSVMHRQDILAHVRRLAGVVEEERWKQRQLQPQPPPPPPQQQGRRSPLLRAASTADGSAAASTSAVDASAAAAAAASSSSAAGVAPVAAVAAFSDEASDRVTLSISPASLCYPFFPAAQPHYSSHDRDALHLSLRLENTPGSPACLFHLVSSHPSVHSFVLPAGASSRGVSVPVAADYGFIPEGGAVTVEVIVRPEEWLGVANSSSSAASASASSPTAASPRSNLNIAEYSFSEFLFSNLVHMDCFLRLQEVEPLRSPATQPQRQLSAPSPRVAAQERSVLERMQRHAGVECMMFEEGLLAPLSARDRFQQLADCWALQRQGSRSYDARHHRFMPSEEDPAHRRMQAVRSSEHAHRRILEAFQSHLLVSHRILVSAKSLASIGRNEGDIRRTSAQAMWDQSAHAAGTSANSNPSQVLSFWAYVNCLWSDGGLHEKSQPGGGCMPATLSEVRDPTYSCNPQRARVISKYWNEISHINPSLPWRAYSLGVGLPAEEDDASAAATAAASASASPALPDDLASALCAVPPDAAPFLVSSMDWPLGLQVARGLFHRFGTDFYSRGWHRPRLVDATDEDWEEEEIPLRQKQAPDPDETAAARRRSAQQQLSGVPQVSWRLFRTIVRLQIKFRRMKRATASRIRSKLLRAQLAGDQALSERIAAAKGPTAAARAKRRMTGAEFLKSQEAQLAAQQRSESNAAARRHSSGPAVSSSPTRQNADAAPEALGSLAALWNQAQSSVEGSSSSSVAVATTAVAAPAVSFSIFRIIVRLQTRMRRLRQAAQRKLQAKLLRAQVAETQRMLDKIAEARQVQQQGSKAPLKSAMKKRVSGAEWMRAQQQREAESDSNFSSSIVHSEESLSMEGGFHIVERFGSGIATMTSSALKSSPRCSVSSSSTAASASAQKKKKSVVWADDDSGAADEIIPAPVYSAEREAFAAQDAARAAELSARAEALRASSAAEVLGAGNLRIFRIILRIQRRFRALKLEARERTKAKLLRQHLEEERRMAEKIRQARTASASGGGRGSNEGAKSRRLSGAAWLQQQLAQDAADRARYLVAPQYETQESLSSSVVVEQLSSAAAAAAASPVSPPSGGVLRRKSVMGSANRRSSMPYADAIVGAKASAFDLDRPVSTGSPARLTFGFIRLIARLQRKFKALRRAAQVRLRDKMIRARMQTERDMNEKLRAARRSSGGDLSGSAAVVSASRKNKRLTGGEWLKAQLASDSASALALEARRDAAAAADREARDRSAAASALFASLSHRVPPSINNLRLFSMIVRIQRRFHALRARAQAKLKAKVLAQHTQQEQLMAAKLSSKNMKVERASTVGVTASAGGSRSAPSSARSSGTGSLTARPRPSSSQYIPNASLLRSRLGISSLRVFHLILRIQSRFLALRARAQRRIKEKVMGEQLKEAARMKEKIALAKEHQRNQSGSRGSQELDAAAALNDGRPGHRSTPSQTRRTTGQEWLAMQLAEAQATIQSLQAAQAAQQQAKSTPPPLPMQYVDSDEIFSSVVRENLAPLPTSNRENARGEDSQQQHQDFNRLHVRTASTPHSAASRAPTAASAASGFVDGRNLLDADQQPDYLYHAVDEQGNKFVLTPVPLAEHQRRVMEQQQQHQQQQQAQYAHFPQHQHLSPQPLSPYFHQQPFRPSPPSRPTSASSFSPVAGAANTSTSTGSGAFLTPSPPSQPRLVNVRMVERSMLSPRTARVQHNNGVAVDPAMQQQQQPFSPYSPSAYDYTQHSVPQHHPHYAQLAAHAYGYPPAFAPPPYGYPPAAYPPSPYPYVYPPPMMAPPPMGYPYGYPPYGYHQPMPPPPPPQMQPQQTQSQQVSPQPPQQPPQQMRSHQTPAPRAQPQPQQQPPAPQQDPGSVPEPVAFDEFAVEDAYEVEQQQQQQPPSPPQPRAPAASHPRAPAPVPASVSHVPSQPMSPQRAAAAAAPVPPSQMPMPMRVSSPSRPARAIRPGSAATVRGPVADSAYAFAGERPSSASSASAATSAAGAEFLRQKRLRRDYLRWTQSQSQATGKAVAAVSPTNTRSSRKQPLLPQQPPTHSAFVVDDADDSASFDVAPPVDSPAAATVTVAADEYDDDEYADDADFEPAAATAAEAGEEEQVHDAAVSPTTVAPAPSNARTPSADFRASRLQAQYIAHAAAAAASATPHSPQHHQQQAHPQSQQQQQRPQQTQKQQPTQKHAWHSGEEMKEEDGSNSGSVRGGGGRVVDRHAQHAAASASQHRTRSSASSAGAATAAAHTSSDDFDLYQPLEDESANSNSYDYGSAPVYPPYHSSYYKQPRSARRGHGRPHAAASTPRR